MIKSSIFLFTLLAFVMVANGQSIAKWKIEDVVRSFSGKNDTTYVVNFWATFCKPCIEEIPHFIRIVEKYKTKKVKLLLVSLDLASYVPVKLPAFIKKNNYKTNHVWLNETNADHFCPMIDPKWSGAIPSTIIVNNNSGYRKFTEDQISPEDFEKALTDAIGGNAKYAAPMNEAEVIDNKSATFLPSGTGGGDEKMTFKSNDSSVYSIMDGKVSNIVLIEGFKVVIIQNDKMFHTYSNLKSTTLKVDEEIKANQLIGYASFDLDLDKPTLDLYVSDNDGKMISLKKANFSHRKDLKLTDHSIELNLQEPQ